ncbi:MAG: response regulator [Thermoleophilia bacterium]
MSAVTPGPGRGPGFSAQHGGWVDVESRPGSGSIFSVFLPAVPREAAEADVVTIPAEGLRGHGEKILLVEDDESVRVLAEKMLSSHNYNVVSAASAEEAFDLFEEASGEFDMAFSDVILPGMDGIRLTDLLRQVWEVLEEE